MKILVLATGYPRFSGDKAPLYIHVRNRVYSKSGIDVTVLSFAAKENYIFDTIPVITMECFSKNTNNYDLLVCHAPNIRNHYFFLRKHQKKFKKIVFFFHGHEVLKTTKCYPRPFPFLGKTLYAKYLLHGIYDYVKLPIWKNYFQILARKSHFIFVSGWLHDRFLDYTKIQPDIIRDKHSIIHNGVGSIFEAEDYNCQSIKKYDFICIRGASADGSKYGVDMVLQLAEHNPKLKFLICGRGKIFKTLPIPPNVELYEKVLSHNEMIDLVNQSKCGIFLTRQDTQGVMTCEMATYGLPCISSDIEVCHEILDTFPNVKLIPNGERMDLKPIRDGLITRGPYSKNERYFEKNTAQQEVRLFRKLIRKEDHGYISV